jgi:hypothetical protein
MAKKKVEPVVAPEPPPVVKKAPPKRSVVKQVLAVTHEVGTPPPADKPVPIDPNKWKINMDAFKDMSIGFYKMDQHAKNLAAIHPKLSRIDSWAGYADDIPVNNLLAYLLFLYSPDSPVNKRYGIQLAERKYQALLLAGFGHLRKKGGDWAADVQTYLIELRNDSIINMIVDYLRLLNQPLWTEINTLEQELEEATRLRIRPVSSIDDKATLQAADIKGKLRRDTKEMLELLGIYRRQFYGDAHAAEMTTKVHKLKTDPESRAKQLLER